MSPSSLQFQIGSEQTLSNTLTKTCIRSMAQVKRRCLYVVLT